MGWLGIPVPEQWGGAGMDALAYAIAIEEIGRVWGSLGADRRRAHVAGLRPDPARRHRRPEARVPGPDGERQGHRRLRADRARRRQRRRRPPDDREAHGRRLAEWVIDGGKRFITNAGQAGTYVVAARTGTTEHGNAEISAFIVPADTPGFSVGRLEEKLGLHASATGELHFDGARVPAGNLLGEEGEGFRTFLTILDGGRISIGALALGLAQAALDAAVPYARERHQFGRPIGTFQAVAFRIADMATEIEAARALVYRAAWLRDQGRDYGLAAAQAKLFASEVAARATNAALLAPRRVRLRRRVPGRAVPARREAHRDRRGHERHPASRDRAQDPRPAGPVAPMTVLRSAARPRVRRRPGERGGHGVARRRPPGQDGRRSRATAPPATPRPSRATASAASSPSASGSTGCSTRAPRSWSCRRSRRTGCTTARRRAPGS